MTSRKNADGTKRRKGGHNKKVFSQPQLDDIKALYVEHEASLRQIATKYGVSKLVVHRVLVEMGVPINSIKRFTGSKVEVVNPNLNLTGFCYCGCGGVPSLRKQSYKKLCWVEGDQLMFLPGHAGAIAWKKQTRYIVDEVTGCWTWQLFIKEGYGIEKHTDGSSYAHVRYWQDTNGPIPKGMVLDHLCRNRSCVNPDHLEVVTSAGNSQRGNRAKLNWDKVRAIRKAYSEGTNSKELSKQYEVGSGHIMDVVNKVCWREDVIKTVPNRPIGEKSSEVQGRGEQASTDSAHGYGEDSLSSQPEFASWLHW